jgi:hypothetical protein
MKRVNVRSFLHRLRRASAPPTAPHIGFCHLLTDPDRFRAKLSLRAGSILLHGSRVAAFVDRQPYAGEAGSRNNFRGDGFFGIDSSLAKTWPSMERKPAVAASRGREGGR